MKKIHARQSTLKKTFMLWPKNIHTRNFVTKKIPADRKLHFPPPPPPPPVTSRKAMQKNIYGFASTSTQSHFYSTH